MKTIQFFLFFLISIIFLGSACSASKYKAYHQMKHLKEGVLLVRLKTKEKTVAKYEEMGMDDRAKVTKAKQQAENADILAAFDKLFEYCPAYFFYSNETSKLRDGNFQEMQLFDAKQDEINADFLKNKYFLVAEFGRAYDAEFVVEGDNTQRRSAGGVGPVDALVVMDRDFVQLERPFPHTTGSILRRSIFHSGNKKENMVNELNFQLRQKSQNLDLWWGKKKLRGKDKELETKYSN